MLDGTKEKVGDACSLEDGRGEPEEGGDDLEPADAVG